VNFLAENLAALAKRNQRLAERLHWPVASAHIQFEDDGQAVYCVQSNRDPFVMSPQLLAEGSSALSEEKALFLFGISLGEAAAHFLASTTIPRITVWDRDPWLIRLALSRNDFSVALSTGRLQILLGTDLIERLPVIMSTPLMGVPFFESKYRNERRLVQEGVGDKRALVCAGTLFVDDLADAFCGAGYSVYTWDLTGLSAEELMLAADTFKPTVVAAINYTIGLVEACEALKCPLVCWEIDPATDRVQAPQASSASMYAFTFRKRNVAEFRRAGFVNVDHLPLATNTQHRTRAPLSDEDRERYGAPVSFVGSSMRREAEVLQTQFWALYGEFVGGSVEDLAAGKLRLERVLKEQGQDVSTYALPEAFGEEFSAFVEWCRAEGMAEAPVRLIAERLASEKRLSYLAALGEFAVHAWGDSGLRQIEAHGGIYRGFAGHRQALPKIYASSSINVDINRIYQPDIVTMRVFDVLACGGFVLAEYSDDLAELFDIGTEIEAFRTLDELKQKVAFFLANADTAKEIAEQGYRRVQRDHTIAKRVETMLKRAALS